MWEVKNKPDRLLETEIKNGSQGREKQPDFGFLVDGINSRRHDPGQTP